MYKYKRTVYFCHTAVKIRTSPADGLGPCHFTNTVLPVGLEFRIDSSNGVVDRATKSGFLRRTATVPCYLAIDNPRGTQIWCTLIAHGGQTSIWYPFSERGVAWLLYNVRLQFGTDLQEL